MTNNFKKLKILELENINKIFRQANSLIPVLKDINFKFDQAFSYSLTGDSGTGKSTLLNIISGLELPSSGTVFLDNQNINKLNKQEKNLLHLESFGLIFQYPYLLPELTVLENIIIKGLISGQNKNSCLDRAHMLLEFISLSHKANFSPKLLSGGEQQRVAIARALFIPPAFLIADEPTAHLDETNKKDILNLFLKLKEECFMGIIIASHDPLVSKFLDINLTLNQGNLIVNN